MMSSCCDRGVRCVFLEGMHKQHIFSFFHGFQSSLLRLVTSALYEAFKNHFDSLKNALSLSERLTLWRSIVFMARR